MNIYVIEDEPPILREIVAIIESFHEDYQIIGTARNGLDAFEFLKKQGEQVDVMITDIQIPVMNGLELISYTHENLPHILSIILTGFSNFDYAQKAIRYNVFDYLLKPVDEEELHKQLKKAYAKKCADYVRNLPEETDSEMSIPVQTSSGYQLALISLGSFPMYASVYNELFPELWKQIELSALFKQYPDLKDNYWIIDGLTLAEKTLLFQVPEHTSRDSRELLSRILSPLLSKDFTVTIAIDPRFQGIRTVHQSILNLHRFINKQVRLEKSQLLFCEEVVQKPSSETDFSSFHPYCLHLSELFVQKKVQLFEAALRNYLNAMHAQDLPTSSVYLLLQDLFNTLIRASDNALNDFSRDVQSTAGDVLMLSDSYDSLYENLCSIFHSLFESILKEDTELTDKTNILLKIDAYMKDNYTQQINTKSVAQQFGFTPAYLSKIFRDYKSITPADYIIRLRMEKAKELFSSDPGCKIKDVATFVGYEDSLYFSKVFKKSTGLSPKQFLEKVR